MRASFASLALIALLVPARAGADEGEQPGAAAKKPCVTIATEARYVNYGYDHIVELRSACEKRQSCTVKTDVAPQPTTVEIDPREAKSVVTFKGSPSSEFKADVSCTAVR